MRQLACLTLLALVQPGLAQDGLDFPDVVRHAVGSDTVQILNIFPEHGLTDPHVMIVDDRLYLGVGHDQSWDTEQDWTMDRWEIWSTDDLGTWRKESMILPEDTYFGPEPNCWAGDFAQKDGKYYWYFSNRNHDTGVMVADAPGGPYRDALGQPILPHGLTQTHSYDPEVFEEDGVHTIIFGAVTYYAATLADDMLSLADAPQPVVVRTSSGELQLTDDKPTVFKRNGIYYLVWGAHYAMSDNLRGPYEYKGAFMAGGHGSIFEWQGQWYVIHEHHDISMFYRGIMLKPMVFNTDGTVNLENDTTYPPSGGRLWDFDRSRMGWRAVSGTDLTWNADGIINGDFSGNTTIESANWSTTSLAGKTLRLRLKNLSEATTARIFFAEFVTDRPEFWKYPEIDWSEEASVAINIEPDSEEFALYELDLHEVEKLPPTLKRLRIEFDQSAASGRWEIDYMRIE